MNFNDNILIRMDHLRTFKYSYGHLNDEKMCFDESLCYFIIT